MRNKPRQPRLLPSPTASSIPATIWYGGALWPHRAPGPRSMGLPSLHCSFPTCQTERPDLGQNLRICGFRSHQYASQGAEGLGVPAGHQSCCSPDHNHQRQPEGVNKSKPQERAATSRPWAPRPSARAEHGEVWRRKPVMALRQLLTGPRPLLAQTPQEVQGAGTGSALSRSRLRPDPHAANYS